MSAFLGYESYLMALGSSIKDVQDNIMTVLTGYGWQVVMKSLVPQAVSGTFGDVTSFNAYAFDNSDWGSVYPSTGVCGATTALPRHLAVQMQTAVTIDSYQVTGDPITPANAPKTWTLEYSDNGTVWTVADTQTNVTGWLPCEVKSFTVGGTPGAHLYWRLNVSASNTGTNTCYLAELRLHTTTGYIISNVCYIYLIPPADQTIGNSNTRELVYMTIGTTTLTVQPVRQMLVNVPHILGVSDKTAGAVAAALTINGVTVTGAVGTIGSTTKDNLRALYTAIRASADANFTAYKWIYQKPSPQNANDALDWIIGIRTPDSAQPVCSGNANVNFYHVMQRVGQTIQTQMMGLPTNTTCTIDLTNGFIFYWQINKRGFAVSTKTNVAYYGPIHACYADHTKALAAMPSTLDSRILSPVELVVGFDGASSVLDSTAYPTNWWFLPSTTARGWDSERNHNGSASGANMFGGGHLRDIFCDGSAATFTPSWLSGVPTLSIGLRGSSIFAGADASGDDFQVHRMGSFGVSQSSTYGLYNPGSGAIEPAATVLPILDIQDWYKFRGTTTNEALCLVADTVAATALSVDCTSSDTILAVSDTSGFQSAGYVIVEQEVIQYTGKTGTTFTGCTRGRYGTTAVNHYNLDACYQGIWFSIINGGALLAGYVKPT